MSVDKTRADPAEVMGTSGRGSCAIQRAWPDDAGESRRSTARSRHGDRRGRSRPVALLAPRRRSPSASRSTSATFPSPIARSTPCCCSSAKTSIASFAADTSGSRCPGEHRLALLR